MYRVYMKKLAVTIIVSIFLISGALAGMQSSQSQLGLPGLETPDTRAYQHTFTFAEPTITTDTYTKVTVDNCDISHTAGAPALPYITHTLTLPWGSVIDNIEISAGETTILPLATKVIPAAEPVPANMQHHQVTRTEGPIYQTVNPYPSAWVSWHTGAGLHNGEHVLYLTLRATPTQYLPASQQLQYVTDINVTVSYTTGTMPLTTADSYDLLIICPREWEAQLEPLVNHKNTHGVSTKVVGLECIAAGEYFPPQGRDQAEQVKYFIKNAVEDWGITYVMLVGGRNGGLFEEKWWCPVRYAHLDDGANWEGRYLSDLYFSDIYNGDGTFSSWDTNENDVFAEHSFMSRDELDLYPDVYLGRLACRNSYEVDTMVDKIITYETSTAGQDWFNRMVLVGGDSAPQAGDPYYEGEEENQAALNYMEGFEGVKLWTSTGSLSGPQDVIDAVSEGCGFLFFDGHGNPMGYSTHPPYDESTWIDGLAVQDMRQLSNDGKYPVCIIGGCHNGQFNVSLLNLLKIYEGYEHWYSYIYKGEMSPECWAWWITRVAGGGAVATLGYTGLDWFATGDGNEDGIPDCTQYLSGFMHVNFFREYGENGLRVLGELHGATITDYLNAFFPTSERLDYKTVEEWALLGDPSLMVGGYS